MSMVRVQPFRLAIAAGLLLAGCGTSRAAVAPAPVTASVAAATTAQPTPVAANAVSIENFEFTPPVITVPVGTTVTWTNKDVEQHTVTARDKSFNSDAVAGDKSFSYTFSKAGSFDYFCQIHTHMTGTVVVTDK
jgi:plastocyanin